MRNARPMGIGALLVFMVINPGCGCSDDGPNPPPATSSSTSTGTGGMGGVGGMAGSGGMGGMGGMVEATIDPAAQDVASPLDATPDPNGETIYFTALDPTLGTGVYQVPATGGASTPVFVGDPFVAPFGITISTDGTQLFVADPGSESGPNDADDAGQIFVLPTAGGNPTPLSGTVGTVPRGVEILFDVDVDTLYFTGRDSSGEVGVFRIPPGGGTATAIAVGTPFVDPSGVAVAKNGDVYVADTISTTARQASILKVASGQGTASVLAGPLSVGYPVGIALDFAETQLIVSGLDPVTQTDVVIIIDLTTNQQSIFIGDADTDISLFEEPAGLHRARNTDIFAWADSKAGTSGTVYTFTF